MTWLDYDNASVDLCMYVQKGAYKVEHSSNQTVLELASITVTGDIANTKMQRST